MNPLDLPRMAGQGLTPAGHFLNTAAVHPPTWEEIVQVVAFFHSAAKTKLLCSDVDCCAHQQPRHHGCACSQEPNALIAADLLNASDKAGKAHRLQERQALRLQMNNKSGYES